MTNLSWFQARDLAQGEGRAIRRTGWQKWLLYRFRVWIVSLTDATTNVETRRVATTDDFRDSEFLAKDWTDEPFTGGSYPPCTTPGPATAAAASVTGGSGAWTRSADLCSGDGQGGGVPPPAVVDGGVVPVITAALLAFDTYNNPISPTSGGAQDFKYILNWSIPEGSITDGILHAWVSGTGLDFTTVAVTASASIAGADGPYEQVVGYPVPSGGEGWSHHFNGPPSGAGYPAGPQKLTARLVLTDGGRTVVIAHLDLSTTLWTP